MPACLDVLIVEDDYSFALELEIAIVKMGHKIISTVDNASDAFFQILDKKPDLIFMDIEIKGELSGLDIANKIGHLQIPIIFLTSFADDKFFDLADSVSNSTYIVKPSNQYSLQAAINLLIKSANSINPVMQSDVVNNNGRVFLKKGQDFHCINITDIVLIKSERIYCKTITSDNQEYLSRISLSEYFSLLNSNSFVKPHRSYLVNSLFIDKMNLSDNIIILGKHSVPISRNSKPELKKQLNLLN